MKIVPKSAVIFPKVIFQQEVDDTLPQQIDMKLITEMQAISASMAEHIKRVEIETNRVLEGYLRQFQQHIDNIRMPNPAIEVIRPLAEDVPPEDDDTPPLLEDVPPEDDGMPLEDIPSFESKASKI